MLEFDRDNLEQTAEIIRRLNPHAAGYSVAELVACMQNDARMFLTLETEPAYIGSRGYVLTLYKAAGTGRAAVHASIATWQVWSYLNPRSDAAEPIPQRKRG